MIASVFPEILSAAVLTAVTVLILNPFDFWMPTMAHMAALAVAVVAFGVFSVFVLRERAIDEREEQQRMFAGRAAFLLGGGVLLLGIIAESLRDALDPWLVGALLAMILGKVAARLYSAWYC